MTSSPSVYMGKQVAQNDQLSSSISYNYRDSSVSLADLRDSTHQKQPGWDYRAKSIGNRTFKLIRK